MDSKATYSMKIYLLVLGDRNYLHQFVSHSNEAAVTELATHHRLNRFARDHREILQRYIYTLKYEIYGSITRLSFSRVIIQF